MDSGSAERKSDPGCDGQEVDRVANMIAIACGKVGGTERIGGKRGWVKGTEA
jgi:hypothetical protein